MSPARKTNPTLKEISKYPAAYVLAAVMSIVVTGGSFLIKGILGESHDRAGDWKALYTDCATEKKKDDSTIKSLSYNNGILTATIDQLRPATDSLLRRK